VTPLEQLKEFVERNLPERDALLARFKELDAMEKPPAGELIAVCQRIVDLQGQFQALDHQTEEYLNREEQMAEQKEPQHYDPTVRAYFEAIGGMPEAELPPEGIATGDEREVIDLDDLDLSEMVHSFLSDDEEGPGEPPAPEPTEPPSTITPPTIIA
jgi:hypothetical protein